MGNRPIQRRRRLDKHRFRNDNAVPAVNPTDGSLAWLGPAAPNGLKLMDLRSDLTLPRLEVRARPMIMGCASRSEPCRSDRLATGFRCVGQLRAPAVRGVLPQPESVVAEWPGMVRCHRRCPRGPHTSANRPNARSSFFQMISSRSCRSDPGQSVSIDADTAAASLWATAPLANSHFPCASAFTSWLPGSLASPWRPTSDHGPGTPR